jgi:hypothetical protein
VLCRAVPQFRLMCREDELRRVFGLFKRLFDCFDQNGDGKIEMKELTRLKDADFIDEHALKQLQTAAGATGTLNYPQFLGFWVGHYLDTAPMSKEEENLLNSALGPIVFKLALEQVRCLLSSSVGCSSPWLLTPLPSRLCLSLCPCACLVC